MRRIEESFLVLSKRVQRTPSNHRTRESRSGETFSNQELGVGECYQQASHIRRQRKEHTSKEFKVDLPYFYGKDNIEAYLDWEMKMEQLFASN